MSNVIPILLVEKARQVLPKELLELTLMDHKLVVQNQDPEGPAVAMSKLMIEMGAPNMTLSDGLETELGTTTVAEAVVNGNNVEETVFHFVGHLLQKGWCKGVTPREDLAKGFALLGMLLNATVAYQATVAQANNGKLLN